MKATGIVRSIDDLGRLVIPKEIRRMLKIQEGDPIELFLSTDNTQIVLQKFVNPQEELLKEMDTEDLLHELRNRGLQV